MVSLFRSRSTLHGITCLMWCEKLQWPIRSSWGITKEHLQLQIRATFISWYEANTFFKIFLGGRMSFLWNHRYPWFGLLVISPLGFKARVCSLIHAWWRCTCYTSLDIHIWCITTSMAAKPFSSMYLQCWPQRSWQVSLIRIITGRVQIRVLTTLSLKLKGF